MTKHRIKTGLLGGVLLVIIGFIYDVFFAGIPYQDPTPAMQARYDFHSKIADVIFWSGVVLMMAGSLAAFYSIKKKKPIGEH